MLKTHVLSPPINLKHAVILRKHNQGPKKARTLTYAEHRDFNGKVEDKKMKSQGAAVNYRLIYCYGVAETSPVSTQVLKSLRLTQGNTYSLDLAAGTVKELLTENL